MAVGFDIGASASTSSAAQSGSSTTGDINITGGGSGGVLSSLLPKVTPNNAWIVWAIVGTVVVLGRALWFRSRR